MTRTVADAAVLLQVLAGYDELDPAAVNQPLEDYSARLQDSIKGMRIARATGDFIAEVTDAEVAQSIEEAARAFKDEGAGVTEVNADFLRAAALANGVMTQADGAAVHRERLRDHPDWFGADILQRLSTGAGFTSTEYSLARRTQAETRRKLELLFKDCDALILPTTPIPAPVLEGEDAIARARLLTRFTAPFNLSGLPALSLPCGFTRAGLPVGLQIVARAWDEAGALRCGYAFERAAGMIK